MSQSEEIALVKTPQQEGGAFWKTPLRDLIEHPDINIIRISGYLFPDRSLSLSHTCVFCLI